MVAWASPFAERVFPHGHVVRLTGHPPLPPGPHQPHTFAKGGGGLAPELLLASPSLLPMFMQQAVLCPLPVSCLSNLSVHHPASTQGRTLTASPLGSPGPTRAPCSHPSRSTDSCPYSITCPEAWCTCSPDHLPESEHPALLCAPSITHLTGPWILLEPFTVLLGLFSSFNTLALRAQGPVTSSGTLHGHLRTE